MDLVTLITACTLAVDPKVMHALVWHQSGGEPWAFSVPGQRQPQVLRSLADAVDAARDTRPGGAAIRVGLAGLPSTPRSVTATMFAPCSNVASAARQIAQFAELCSTSSRATGDPIHCAVAAYRGSWERPDDGFADAVSATVAKGDAPDFEMPAETAPGPDMDSPRQLASHDAVPPPPVADDYQRARESPLFPVMSTSFDRPPIDRPDGGHLTAAVPGIDGPANRLTAAPPAAHGLFAPRSGQLAPAKPE